MRLLFFLIFSLIGLIHFSPIESKRTPTLIVSFDGFRADKLDEFLSENPSSFLKRYFVNAGVKADFMQPSFPTVSLPNHFTIATGLFMENHGIVENTFYDSVYNQKVDLFNDDSKNDVKWWNKTDPIWLTAKNQGLKTSTFFWAGSEVWTRHPDIFLTNNYDDKFTYDSRINEVVNWFKKFNIDFGTLYFDEPDSTGHSYGPDSSKYKNMINQVDITIGYLMTKLVNANLLDKINVLIVSDHGMTAMNNKTLIVKDYVDVDLIDNNKTVYGIVSNIYPKNESVKQKVYDALKTVPYLTVYFKEDMPERFHFRNSNRIAPIIAITNEGYIMNTTEQNLVGNHGFDNEYESMRAIFLARGPDFKSNVTINGLKNVDIYPLLCDLLEIVCHPNNGSLLPFRNALNNKTDISSTITTSSFSFKSTTTSESNTIFANKTLIFILLLNFFLLFK